MSPFAQAKPQDPSEMTVMVVDDEALVRELAVDALSSCGFHVISAKNGSEALEAARGGSPIHVLFTDIQMPGEPDGVGLAHRLREMMPDLGVVISSGRVSPRSSDLPNGAIYSPKPWGVTEIIQSVTGLLEPKLSPSG